MASHITWWCVATLVLVSIAIAQPPAVTQQHPSDEPSLGELSAGIARGSQVALSWSAANAARFEIYATPTIAGGPVGTPIETLEGDARQALVPIPDRARQVLHVCAVGTTVDAKACAAVRLTNVVTRDDDYDPYGLGDWQPEPSLEGTLRAVIASADRGSTIGFAADVRQVDLYGVAMVYVNPVDPDAIRPGEGWQDGHLIIDRDLVISGRPNDPVILLARSGCDACGDAEAFTFRSRVLRVLERVSAELEYLELAGGGFVFDGAGIRNDGTLTLREVTIRDNRAWYEGGGIYNGRRGILTLVDTVVRDNTAAVFDDEVGATLRIRGGDATIEVEDGGFGGGLFNAADGSVTVRGGSIERNQAKISGGGAYNLGGMTISGAAVEGNVADHTWFEPAGAPLSLGGGIYSSGTLTMSSASVVANFARDAGGGLMLWPGATTTLEGVVVQQNTANVGGGIRYEHLAGEADALVTTALALEDNEGGDLSVQERAAP